jgi:anti-sigma factor RsiW
MMQHLDEGTLQAWLDGARSGLDPSRLDRIERHLAECAVCAARVDELAQSSFRAHALLAVGRAQYAPRVPYEDVAARVHATHAPARPRVRKVAAVWAASIVGALATGWVSNDLYSAQVPADAGAVTVAPVLATPPTGIDAALPARVLAESGPTPLDLGTTEPSAELVVAAPAVLTDDEGLVVRGLVEDEGGRPVPSAQVYVTDLEVGVLTQPDGRYDLRLPAEPDSFELVVQRIGYRQQARAIISGEGDYVDADFRLREEALALDEIVVTGSGAAPRRPRESTPTNSRSPFVWRPLSSITAEGYVGSDLWMLPRLYVLTIEVAYGDNPNETHIARVRQDLGDGATLTIIQGRTDGRRARWPIQSAGAVLSTWRGEMLITATAPVSTDELRELLTQLR